MKDKETQRLIDAVKAFVDGPEYVRPTDWDELRAALVAIESRPATMEDRALDALEYCVKTLALEFDYRPDEPEQWDAARALLREAGRVK